MTDPRSMSNAATSMYSTWFSDESDGYCDRSLLGRWWGRWWCWFESADTATGPPDIEERWDGRTDADVEEASDSLTAGGCGDRAGRAPGLEDSDEGEREDGKEEKEGDRWMVWEEDEAAAPAFAGRCARAEAM